MDNSNYQINAKNTSSSSFVGYFFWDDCFLIILSNFVFKN